MHMPIGTSMYIYIHTHIYMYTNMCIYISSHVNFWKQRYILKKKYEYEYECTNECNHENEPEHKQLHTTVNSHRVTKPADTDT